MFRQTSSFNYFLFKNSSLELILFSFLMLFVELTIIRWAGANIFYLFFFANFILLASFLGIGLGFLRSKSTTNLFAWFPMLLMAVILFCDYFSYEYKVHLQAGSDNLDYSGFFFHNNVYPIWVTLPCLFIMTTILMLTVADGLARCFQHFPPLKAYRLEVLGSLLGTFVFAVLSFFHTTPFHWGIIICIVYLFLLMNKWHDKKILIVILQFLALCITLGTLAKGSSVENYLWSSYYKINLQKIFTNSYVVNVNGLPQQIIEPVTQRKKLRPFYFFPYKNLANHQLTQLNNVLVIGAGTGGDVAIALAEGAKNIDAIEIDPVLYAIGKKLNPNQPYLDPRVHVFINDGRAFLEQNTTKYDMIIFALTDSLMLIPGQSSLRLENFLYTFESINTVRKHLTPTGIFTIYNYYRPHWILDRLANTVYRVFNQVPCIDSFSAADYWANVITVGATANLLQCEHRWKPVNTISAQPATDNHPFIYFEKNQLSFMYIITLSFVLCVLFGTIKVMRIPYTAFQKNLDLFFMGAAFLLLETKNIVNFALLFGSTWFVNALVFIGILSTVYLAIETINYLQYKKQKFLALSLPICLFFSFCIAWAIPNSYLLSLSWSLRFIIATTLAFTPIYIANLIFAQRFRETAHARDAFGVNLIGAMLGGLLEYSSIIFGYQNILLITGVLYLFAILIMAYYRRFSLHAFTQEY